MPAGREYIIFCDESVKKGAFYSNFYGGVLVDSVELLGIERRLKAEKQRLGFTGELKWSKVTDQYLRKYQDFIDAFFKEVSAGRVRMRVMFTQNAMAPDLQPGQHKRGRK